MSLARRPLLQMAGLAAAAAAAMAGSLMVGPVWVPPGQVVAALVDGPPSPDDGQAFRVIVRELRLPRALLAGASGFALGMAGAGLQGLFRNPLADPYVVGASGGAALGATLAILGNWQSPAPGLSPVAAAAFVGALGSVAVVYLLAEASGAASSHALLVVGAAVSTLLSALVAALLLFAERPSLQVYGWLVGGFSGRSWPSLWASLPPLALGSLALAGLHRSLDALALGEETAQSLGVALHRLRAGCVAASSLLTAAAVASGGIIGFVGLMAPHMARRLLPATHRWVLPASGLLGALVLVAADSFGRVVMPPAEVPAGIFTSVLGSPFFLYLLRRQGGRAGAP